MLAKFYVIITHSLDKSGYNDILFYWSLKDCDKSGYIGVYCFEPNSSIVLFKASSLLSAAIVIVVVKQLVSRFVSGLVEL